MPPNVKRGFHLTRFADLSNGCLSAGHHYNPFNTTHGDLYSIERHVGDFGNL
jgi:Cu-Zn family superoxide dismutase